MTKCMLASLLAAAVGFAGSGCSRNSGGSSEGAGGTKGIAGVGGMMQGTAGQAAGTTGSMGGTGGWGATVGGKPAGTGGSAAGAGGKPAGTGGSTGGSAGSGGGSGDGSGGGMDQAKGQLSGVVHVNNFGWRPNDQKLAVLVGNAGVPAELRKEQDNSVAWSGNASATLQADADSTDQVATVDFSEVTTTGDYYLYLPSLNVRSYPFRIAGDVYAVVGAASVKSYYFQRCNHDKALPYASDALSGFTGHGGQWVDAACHSADFAAPAAPGSVDDGPLDVHGGWHDAGNYEKTLWNRGVPEMLFAYEMNPSSWSDGQLNIPESGNGVPDILDEAAWELDFYLRMQRPDGHFMTSTHGSNGTISSPPSKSDEARAYYDGPDGPAGQGVTIPEATGNAVLSLAHAAIVFRSIGQTAKADGYAAAATAGWSWLNGQALTGGLNQLKAAAASAVFRMDPKNVSAQACADRFAWDTFDGQLPYSATPAERVMSTGAYHYLANAAGTPEVAAKAKAAIATLADRAFQVTGAYGGMFSWDWNWGSNSAQSMYGANLFMALHFNAIGAHSATDVAVLAQKHLHFMLGLNPLDMVYLTNMAAYGGEHSSFQLYHGWFSYTAGDQDHGNTTYNGKPTWVNEPMYPYYADDSQLSTYGPAPGIVPGGPNPSYSGAYVIPNLKKPSYAYRDFSAGCEWNAATNSCDGKSWEVTEPDVNYQGAFVLLVSFLMNGQ